MSRCRIDLSEWADRLARVPAANAAAEKLPFGYANSPSAVAN